MEWFIEQSTQGSGYWLVPAGLTALVFIFDERSWRALAASALHTELQRFRLHLIPLALTAVGLTALAGMRRGVLIHVAVTALSALIFHIYQRTVFRFSGRPMTGAFKRILLIMTAALIAAAMAPGVAAVWVPLVFITASAVSSLSSRNYLIFKINDESMAMRLKLMTHRAEQHNQAILADAQVSHLSDYAGDNSRKAG